MQAFPAAAVALWIGKWSDDQIANSACQCKGQGIKVISATTVNAMAADAPPKDPPPEGSLEIKDPEFVSQLEYLRRLKTFMITRAIPVTAEAKSALDLGNLSNLNISFFARSRRPPTVQEWKLLDDKTATLISCLPVEERKRFPVTQAARTLLTPTICFLLMATLVLLAAYAFYPRISQHQDLLEVPVSLTPFFTLYVTWIVLLGALGAIAFILVNALDLLVLSSPSM